MTLKEIILMIHVLSGISAVFTLCWYAFSQVPIQRAKEGIIASNSLLLLTACGLLFLGSGVTSVCSSMFAYVLLVAAISLTSHKLGLTGCPYLDGLT